MNRALLVFVFMLTSVLAIGQINTLSPYSIYGLGDSPYSSHSGIAAMGHTGIATLSTLNINNLNPATQTYISRPTFNFDIRNEALLLKANGETQSNSLLSIENMSFAFPIINSSKRKRKATVSFGIVPYTRQGYEVVSNEMVQGVGNVEYRFIGQGGINSAFFSGSFDLIADSGKVNTLSIGVRGAYVFGSITQNRITTLDTNILASNLYRTTKNEISAADVKIGVLYTRKLNFSKEKNEELFGSVSAGAFYKPAVTLNGFSNDVTYTFVNDYKNALPVDTIAMTEGRSPTFAPAHFGLGFSFTYDNRWNLGLDISHQQWSQLEVDGVNQGLNNSSRVSFGAEYTPDPTSYKQLLSIIRYRAGFSAEQTRLNVAGIQPNQISLNTGLGVPIIATRSTSMLNLGIEYAIRGADGLPVTEQFFNFYFGFSITPNQYDRWFVKRKYD